MSKCFTFPFKLLQYISCNKNQPIFTCKDQKIEFVRPTKNKDDRCEDGISKIGKTIHTRSKGLYLKMELKTINICTH